MAAPSSGPIGLLDEEVERRLGLGAHLDGPGAQGADPVGQPQHPLPGPAAAIRFHAHTGPEALAGQIAGARRDPGHAGRHQEDVDRLGRMDEVEGQAIARAKDHGAAGTKDGRNVAREDLGDHLIGQEHADDVVRGGDVERHHFEPVGPRLIGVFVVPVADPDLDAGVSQIQGGGTAQVAVAQHGHLLGGQRAGQRVARPIDLDVPLAWSGHRVGKVPRSAGSVIALSPGCPIPFLAATSCPGCAGR